MRQVPGSRLALGLAIALAGLLITGNEAGAAPPANDNFADAVVIGGLPYADARNTTDSTLETGEPQPSCAPAFNTVWYRFTAPFQATFTVESRDPTDFDTVIAVYTGDTLGNLSPVGCNDNLDPNGFLSLVNFPATAGTVYQIQVGGALFDWNYGFLAFNVREEENPAVNQGSCADGRDNDADGLVDAADPGCTVVKVIPDPFSSGGDIDTTVGGYSYETMGFDFDPPEVAGSFAVIIWGTCEPTTELSQAQQTALIDYVRSGGRLIIYDVECPDVDHTWLPGEVSMTTSLPPPSGRDCRQINMVRPCYLAIVQDTAIANRISSGTAYIDTLELAENSDAVSDMGIMKPNGPAWCMDMKGMNIEGKMGASHAHAFLTSEQGSRGLLIYNGLDADDMGVTQGSQNWLTKLLLQELQADASTLPDLDPETMMNPRCLDTGAPICSDTDQDGLCNDWETNGIDVDRDGQIDLELYDLNGDGVILSNERADPNHKDLYVEIDWMGGDPAFGENDEGHKPATRALADLFIVFSNAPNLNPDGTTGVRLHLQMSDQVAHTEKVAFPAKRDPCTDPASGVAVDFDSIKGPNWGTAKERDAAQTPDWQDVLAAKRLVFHYALFGHDLQDLNGELNDSTGCSELPGNDFLITLGQLKAFRLDSDKQSGTFMHELGHNLGLGHGGTDIATGAPDNTNCKPNYLSVMTYSRQFPDNPIPRGTDPISKLLDYSLAALPQLDERSLNENVGVGGPAGQLTAYGPPTSNVTAMVPPTEKVDLGVKDGQYVFYTPAHQPIDWNIDGDFTDASVLNRDINRMDADPAIPDTGCDGLGLVILKGHNDWNRLNFDFLDSVDNADGTHFTGGFAREITTLQALALSPDNDDDGIPNVIDNCINSANPVQEDLDGDMRGDQCDNCATAPNEDQRNTDSDQQGDACDPDDDNDIWSDAAESMIGTNSLSACSATATPNDEAVDPWPPDFNDDTFVDVADLGAVVGLFGKAVPPAPARNDIAPATPNGFVDIGDVGDLAARFGRNCLSAGPSGPEAGGPDSGLPPVPGAPVLPTIISGDTNIFNAGPGGTSPNPATDEGNFYAFDNTAPNNKFDPADANTAGMRLGPIDECSVVSWSEEGVDSDFYVDIVVENVTDLTGYQVRINYDESKVTYLGPGNADIDGNSSGFIPFLDRKTTVVSELVGFVNLPVEDQTNGHRANNSSETSGAGTALVGDTYQGSRSAALSADTPSANAPEGGILVRTRWLLTAPSDGQTLTFDISAATVPGTKVLLFDPANPEGNIEQVLAEAQLRDFRVASDGPSGTNPACGPLDLPPLPTPLSSTALTGPVVALPGALGARALARRARRRGVRRGLALTRAERRLA